MLRGDRGKDGEYGAIETSQCSAPESCFDPVEGSNTGTSSVRFLLLAAEGNRRMERYAKRIVIRESCIWWLWDKLKGDRQEGIIGL